MACLFSRTRTGWSFPKITYYIEMMMKIRKQLPLTMAVIAALCPISVLAQEMISQQQLDKIVAQAVEKALAEREARVNAAALQSPPVATAPVATAPVATAPAPAPA